MDECFLQIDILHSARNSSLFFYFSAVGRKLSPEGAGPWNGLSLDLWGRKCVTERDGARMSAVERGLHPSVPNNNKPQLQRSTPSAALHTLLILSICATRREKRVQETLSPYSRCLLNMYRTVQYECIYIRNEQSFYTVCVCVLDWSSDSWSRGSECGAVCGSEFGGWPEEEFRDVRREKPRLCAPNSALNFPFHVSRERSVTPPKHTDHTLALCHVAPRDCAVCWRNCSLT